MKISVRNVVIFLFVGLLFFECNETYSQACQDCTTVLLQRNFQLINENDVRKVAYLNSIDEQQYYKLKESVGAEVPGYFTGNWDKFKEERKKLLQTTQYNASVEQSRSALTNLALPGSVEAWSECIRLNSQVSIFAHTVSGDYKGNSFTVNLIWNPGPDIANKPLVISASILPGLSVGQSLTPGIHSFPVTRANASSEIRFSVTGSPGSYARSVEIFVPAFIKPIFVSPYVLGRNDIESCISRGGNNPESCFRNEPLSGSINTIFTAPDDTIESKATFRVPPGANYFRSRIGSFSCTQGGALVYIMLNGSIVWPSPMPSSNWPGTPDVIIPIPAGTNTITLAANPKGSKWCDDIAWLDAMFLDKAP